MASSYPADLSDDLVNRRQGHHQHESSQEPSPHRPGLATDRPSRHDREPEMARPLDTFASKYSRPIRASRKTGKLSPDHADRLRGFLRQNRSGQGMAGETPEITPSSNSPRASGGSPSRSLFAAIL